MHKVEKELYTEKFEKKALASTVKLQAAELRTTKEVKESLSNLLNSCQAANGMDRKHLKVSDVNCRLSFRHG